MNANLARYADEILQEAVRRYPMGYIPTIRWKRLRVSAGLAYYRRGEIGLSSLILDTPEKVRDTLLHEYAHLLAYYRHGQKAANHGVYWKQAMEDLGQEPKVRHTYACERNAARQRVIYRCQTCGAMIERTRRLPRRRKYVHSSCGGDIRLVAIESATFPSRVA